MPLVRQLVAAKDDGLLKEVGGVDGDRDFVDNAASRKVVGDGVTVDASLIEEDTTPESGIALANHDRIVDYELGLVDGELQAIDAVAAVLGDQRVEIDTRLREFLSAPEIRKLMVADVVGLGEQVFGSLVDGEGDDAVAESVTVEGDGIDTLSVEVSPP